MGGVGTQLVLAPAQDVAVVVLSNASSRWPSVLANEILAALIPEPEAPGSSANGGADPRPFAPDPDLRGEWHGGVEPIWGRHVVGGAGYIHESGATMKAATTLVLGALALAGCAGGGTVRQQSPAAPSVGRTITASQIRDSGASSVWEALKFNVRTHYFGEAKGTPTGIQSKRGRGSMVLREDPLVFLDGAQLTEFQVLRHMPAHIIDTITVLNSADGTTYYGTNASGGVILIATTMGRR